MKEVINLRTCMHRDAQHWSHQGFKEWQKAQQQRRGRGINKVMPARLD
jgi:hypothetical protein